MKRNNSIGIFLLLVFTVLIAGCTFENSIEALREKLASPEVYVYFTVTFESNGGSYVEPQTIKGGEKAAEPQGVNNTGYTFYGWYTDDGFFNDKWDFNLAVTKDITLYAKWVFEGEIVPGETLAEQLDWLETNAQSDTIYSLTANADEDLIPYILSYDGISNITLRLQGDTDMRTVSLSGNGSQFTVEDGITLILEDIILRGHSVNNNPLILVTSGGVLEMRLGSVVTGNYGNFCGGVYVDEDGTFVMYGGEISGNTASFFGGGVYVNSGTFTMRGGEIFGNTAYEYGGGVYVNEDGTFTKTGGTIYGYTTGDSTSNVVKDSVDVLSYRGHAVYVDSVPAKFRETTADTNVNLDSDVFGIEGGWGYTVTFNKNNSDSGSLEADPAAMRVELPARTVGTLPEQPQRTGYIFTHWNTQPDGSGTEFTAAASVTEDITVYAQWEFVPSGSFIVTLAEP